MPPQKNTSPQSSPQQAEPHITEQTAPQADAHTPQQTSRPHTAPANWYTDTLRTIVNRALDADKPDIKGALAALAMLAEAEEPAETSGDIANLLRDARKRAAHAREHTD